MFFLDILKFLSPYSGKFEILPIVFFLVIGVLFVTTWINLTKQAKPENWQANWEQNNLALDQGSASELSDTIATKAERAALTMPGIILIIGLLGTFIGLGLALDKASTILSSADMNNMDNSMAQLMGMMEGLGTKFKTSTWGLIAFLLLKVIASRNGFEERRLAWVSAKIKEKLERRNAELRERKNQKLDRVLNSISALTAELSAKQVASTESRSQLLNEINKNSLEEIIKKLAAVGETNQAQIQALSDGIQLVNGASLKRHKELMNAVQNQHAELTAVTDKMSQALAATFVSSIAGLTEQQAEYSRSNQDNLNNLAQRICSSIEGQQSKITEAVDKNSQYLDATAKESQKTRQAMDKFVNESLTTIENLKESASGMSKAAKGMGSSASKLQTVIDNMSKEMNALLATMKSDLGVTIANMDKSFVSNMNKMTKDLNATIGDMNLSFKQNMTEMSKGLGKATDDISKAVIELSSSVNETMTNVSSTINQSMGIQKKAQAMFVETSDNLNEKIIQMTQLVEKLSNDITSGLKTISESNRQVISLNNRYNNSSEQIEELVRVMEGAQQNSGRLSKLLSDIRTNMQNNQVAVARIDAIEQACQDMVKLLKDSAKSQWGR